MKFALVFSLLCVGLGKDLTCQMFPAYPPPANSSVPWYELNLDLPAKDRWTPMVSAKATEIAALVKVITNLIPDKFLKPILVACTLSVKSEFLDRFPEDYGVELQAIAQVTKIPICELLVYNLAYEVLGGCTSMVVQDNTGYVRHGRNLDFGLGPFNGTEEQWQLTDALRPLIYNVNYTQGGKTLFTGVHYAGYIGTLTAVKKGAFSLTVDSRFDNTYEYFLVEWLQNTSDTANFLSFLTRQAFESQNDYAGALDFLTTKDMVGPSYIILGGVKPGEGAVITNSPNMTHSLNVWTLAQGLPNGTTPYYLLQTNYDHWVKPPFFDNRNAPAEDCLNKLGPNGMTKANVYNVLHAHPNRNRLTTYTTLIDVPLGELETSIQYCTEAGCSLW